MAQIVVAQQMWQRRDSAANWTARNPTLHAGEIGVELGSTPAATKFKIGDGTTPWSTLPYFSGGGGGKSAYEIAVDNGFVGTQQQWLDSLQGPIGETGPTYIPYPKAYLYQAGDYAVDASVVEGTTRRMTKNISQFVKEGDLLFAYVVHRGAVTTPAGWTLAYTQAMPPPVTTVQSISVYTKRAQASDAGGTVSFVQASTNNVFTGQVLTFRASDGKQAEIQMVATASNFQASSLPTPAGITSGKYGQVALFLGTSNFAQTGSTSSSLGPPPSMSPMTTTFAIALRLVGAYKTMVEGESITGDFTTNSAGTGSGLTAMYLMIGPTD